MWAGISRLCNYDALIIKDCVFTLHMLIFKIILIMYGKIRFAFLFSHSLKENILLANY